MSTLFGGLALLTRCLGSPISAQTLAANTLLNDQGRPDLNSCAEVLRSHGYESRLSQRRLDDIPPAMLPALATTLDGGGLVLMGVVQDGAGERSFEILRPDGARERWSQERLQSVYSGYCWFLKAKASQDTRSELPEYAMKRGWFWQVIWRFRGYYLQVVIASVLINVLALIGSLYVMNVYDRVIPNRAYETLWVLSIGVLAANVFELLARTIGAFQPTWQRCSRWRTRS